MRSSSTLGAVVAQRLFLDRQLGFWLGELGVHWPRSRDATHARVVDVIVETPDTRTFVLEPRGAWPGHRAGQHTSVEVEIDGVRLRRCYSLSSPPSERRVALTVKRVPDGRVSGWLHDHVRAGNLLTLGAPVGDFVLDEVEPGPLLFLSAGSGITPMLSMLRDLAARDAVRDVIFVHHARSSADVIARHDLSRLAGRHRRLRLLLLLDDEPARRRGFQAAELSRLVPDFATRTTYLCGPPGFMEAAEATWNAAGASARLRRERFSAAPRTPAAADGASAVAVRLRGGRSIVARQSATLLEQLEQAGERPPSGCRMGICQSCKCRKHHGAVENLLTGAISSDPDEDIQLCISVPRSDVELGL